MFHVWRFVLLWVVLAVLFFVLSPGVLLTLPPVKKCKNKKGSWHTQLSQKQNGCATSWASVGVHSVLFGLLAALFLECCFDSLGKMMGMHTMSSAPYMSPMLSRSGMLSTRGPTYRGSVPALPSVRSGTLRPFPTS
jgi:hypothetical protein